MVCPGQHFLQLRVLEIPFVQPQQPVAMDHCLPEEILEDEYHMVHVEAVRVCEVEILHSSVMILMVVVNHAAHVLQIVQLRLLVRVLDCLALQLLNLYRVVVDQKMFHQYSEFANSSLYWDVH